MEGFHSVLDKIKDIVLILIEFFSFGIIRLKKHELKEGKVIYRYGIHNSFDEFLDRKTKNKDVRNV